MVHTPIKPSITSDRQEVIDWLIAHNYPALPVAPAQEACKYYKLVKVNPEEGYKSYCPLTIDLQPIPLYTGKNPSYLDKNGVPHLVNHRQYQNRLPSKRELEAWFANPANGIGTLGGWNDTVWLDFDVKQFPSQEECDTAVQKILFSLERQQTFIERSHSGGWRIGVKVKQKPDFTNFSLTPGGSHVGEALFEGRFTVLAPTIGPSGNPYRSCCRTIPVEVESLKSMGIYSTSKKGSGEFVRCCSLESKKSGEQPFSTESSNFAPNSSPTPSSLLTKAPIPTPPIIPGSIPLEMLGNNTSRNILGGNCPTGDRSEALATATQEWYGWQNWAQENGIHIIGDAATLAHHAGSLLGLDSDRINRILKTIDSGKCHPAAHYRGGDHSCWQKIHRLDKATFETKCPAHIKDAITSEWGHGSSNGNGSGGGRRGNGGIGSGSEGDGSDGDNRAKDSRVVKIPSTLPIDTSGIRRQIKNILIQDLPPSELQTAKIRIRTDNPRVSEREISRLFETIEQELELEESREHRRSEVDNLLKLGDQSVNISEFLPADLAQPLKELAQNLNIRPEVCLTSLLVAASSLHKTKTELVIHRGQGFSVPPTIFAGLVSESGQKKSPILKAIIKKPLSVLQREKREAFQEAQARYEKDIASWDKCKSEERSSKFPEGKPKLPQQRLYYFTNATGEGILYQFQAHPDKALLALVDELVGLFASQNKYSGGRGSDRQDILSAFDGTGATVLRAAGTKADIDGLLLSICGTIQPEVLKRLMRDCSDPDGQWARFLFVNQPLSAATLADDNGGGFDLSGRLLNYYRAIDQLPTREYRLSREAFKRYQPVYNQLEQLRVTHPNPGMRAVYSKMEGYIGRLALNLHVLFELAVGKTLPSEEIPLSILERAIALAKFYIGQVKLIHANCAADLGEMAPHLAKVVELSKRMDTTGISWIKAKIVQSGYDSRHRPRPDAVRSWFRELEALGIGSTRGTGIRLEYSWKLPDLPFDEPDPPPQQKVEKSGEKWITSPPTQTTQNQGFIEKEEKVDNPPHLCDLGLPNLDVGLRDVDIKPKTMEPNKYALNTQFPIVNSQSESLIDRENSSTQSPAWDEHLASQSLNSLETTHSTYPLSGCDDGVAGTEMVDTISPFSPPVEPLSTFPNCEEPDEKAEVSTIKVERRPDAGSGGRGDSVQTGNQTPSEHEPLNQEIQWGYQTLGTSVPDMGVETLQTLRVSASGRPRVIFDEKGTSESDKKPFPPVHCTLHTSVESLETGEESVAFRVFPQNQCQEPIDSTAPTGVEIGWKVLISATAPTQNIGNFEEYFQAVVTVEEVTTDLDIQGCTESNSAVPAEPSEQLPKSAFVPTSLRSPLSFCKNAGLRTAIFSSLLAFVTAVGLQGHRSILVKWSSHSPNPQEATEPLTIVEPSVTETVAEVDRFQVGDRVIWDNCPSHCEQFAPFEITAIDGDYAKLDLFKKPVLLTELHMASSP